MKEDDLQKLCVGWFDLQYPKLKLNLYHTPNGGQRNPREGAKFKAMGVRAGVADLTLAVARGAWHGMYIELKTPKGVQGQTQKVFQQAVEEQGYRYEVCRSFEEFKGYVTNYLEL